MVFKGGLLTISGWGIFWNGR